MLSSKWKKKRRQITHEGLLRKEVSCVKLMLRKWGMQNNFWTQAWYHTTVLVLLTGTLQALASWFPNASGRSGVWLVLWLPRCRLSPWLGPGTQLPARGSHAASSLPRRHPRGLCHFPLAGAATSCTGIGPHLQHSYPDWLVGGVPALRQPQQLRWVCSRSGTNRSGPVPNCCVKGRGVAKASRPPPQSAACQRPECHLVVPSAREDIQEPAVTVKGINGSH